MPGNYTPPTRAAGTVLTSNIYNADHAAHQTNMVAAIVDDYSANVTEMQIQTDPGEAGSESLATSVAGELERIRFILAEMKGQTHWYETGYLGLTIAGSDATLTIQDTDGVWGTAIPSLAFQDSAATVGGRLKFDATETLFLENIRTTAGAELELNVAGANAIRMNTELGVNIRSGSLPALVFTDTGGAGAAALGKLIYRDSTEAVLATIGFESPDAHFEMTNSITGGNLELRTTSGEVQIIDTAPKLQLEDTDAASDAALTASIHLGRTATLNAGVIGFEAADAHMAITNNVTGGNLELKCVSGEFDFVSNGLSKRIIHGLLATPEGFVVGKPGDIYISENAGISDLFVKRTGASTNTGWRVMQHAAPA